MKKIDLGIDMDLTAWSFVKTAGALRDAMNFYPGIDMPHGPREWVLYVHKENEAAQGLADYYNKHEYDNIRVVYTDQTDIDDWALTTQGSGQEVRAEVRGA